MKYQIPLEIFPIEDDGFHLKIKAQVNGSNAELLIDTGASKSVFDETRLGNLIGNSDFELDGKLSTGLGTSSMESKIAVIDALKLDQFLIENYEVAVLDLSHVNMSYEKLELSPIDGVIGSDLLLQYHATIDYKNSVLLLED